MSFRLAHRVWALTAVFILLLTAAPFHFDTSRNAVLAHLSRVRFHPLISPDTGRRISIPDFVQNLILFVPFGAAAAWASGGDRPIRHIVSVVLLASALSVTAESMQLLTTNRISSLADVLANTMGALTGAVTVRWLRKRQSASFIDPADTNFVAAPTYPAMVASGLLVCVACWAPFDVTLDVGVVVGHLKALRADPWQVSFSIENIVVYAQFLLFGFMVTQWLREVGARFPIVVGIGAVITAAIALEASQVLIASQLPTVAGAFVNAGAGVAGAVVSRLYADVRSKLRVLTAVCLVAAAIVTVHWMDGRERSVSALRDVGLCVAGAWLCLWRAARVLTNGRTVD